LELAIQAYYFITTSYLEVHGIIKSQDVDCNGSRSQLDKSTDES